MFHLAFRADGGESHEYKKWVCEKYSYLLGCQTISQNSIRSLIYSRFFKAVLYKISAKPRLAKKSKQLFLGMISEGMESNQENTIGFIVDNITR